MKNFIAIILFLTSVAANACEPPKKLNIYLRGDIGKAWTRWEDSDIYIAGDVKTQSFYGMYGGAIGYKFNDMLRVDVNGQIRDFEYLHKDDDNILSQDVRNYSVFTNFYINIPTEIVLSPYITAGIGLAHNSTKNFSCVDITIDACDVNQATGQYSRHFSWNIGGGVITKMYKNIDMDISYRYLDLGQSRTKYVEVGIEKESVQNMRAHQINLGIIFNF